MSHYNRFYDFINDILKSSQHETGFTTLRIFNEKKKTGRYLILSIGNCLDCEMRLYILEWSQEVEGMF